MLENRKQNLNETIYHLNNNSQILWQNLLFTNNNNLLIHNMHDFERTWILCVLSDEKNIKLCK